MFWKNLISDFIKARGGGWDTKTLSWYLSRLKIFEEFAGESDLAAGQVSAADLNRFNGHLKRSGWAYATRQGTLTALRAFVRWLSYHQKQPNPFDDPDYRRPRKERQVREAISLDWAGRMIRAAEKEGGTLATRDAAIMRLLLTAGLRREEVVKLRLAWLDLDSRELKVVGKFGHQRRVSLRVTTIAALRRWLEVRPATSDPDLFITLAPGSRGIYHAMGPQGVHDLLIRWRDAAGLPVVSVSAHKWRRRFATELARGKNPFALQLLMGHSDIATTNDYVIGDPETLRDLVDRYGPDIEDENGCAC